MNVVILNDFAYVDGGASRIALGSARALARTGDQVTVFSAVGPVDPDYLGIENLNLVCLDQNEIVSDANRIRAATRGLWNQQAASTLRLLLKEFDPERTIVHLHTWTKGLTSSVIRATTEAGFSLVVTLHDYFTVCPTGSFFIHSDQQICRLEPMSLACVRTNCDSRSYHHKLWRTGRQWVQSHIGGLPGTVRNFISLSNLSERVLKPLLPEQAIIHRIPNFIEGAQEAAVTAGQFDAFTFVGRLSPEKGPLLLAQCARHLGVEVRFVGDGPLRDQIAASAPGAVLTGWLEPEQVREQMRTSRALVFPSLWYETQGLVVAEALSLGVPVIVPSTSAAREWVEDGVTGLVFQGGSADDLARQVGRLRDSPELAGAMGSEAYRRYWSDPATLTKHCDALRKCYARMLSRR